MAKKVGNAKPDAAKTKEEKGRKDFAPAKDILNADGLMTSVPGDFDYRKNKPLKKTAFASEDVYIDYQGLVAEQKAAFFTELAKERRDRADHLRKFGDADTRRKAKKLERATKQALLLQKELEAQGIDVSEILAGLENTEEAAA
jgi:hypothetical protein